MLYVTGVIAEFKKCTHPGQRDASVNRKVNIVTITSLFIVKLEALKHRETIIFWTCKYLATLQKTAYYAHPRLS